MTSSSSLTSFEKAYSAVERLIENRYGIPVHMSDIEHPNTGDLDGSKILVDYDQTQESALFVLIHLFGHTVQWNISQKYREIGLDLTPGKSEEFLAEIYDYEKKATRFSLQLMHDAGVHDLDRWVSDWWAADWAYLAHFYRTGEKIPFETFMRPGEGELLTPLAIPPFSPQRWVSRWSF